MLYFWRYFVVLSLMKLKLGNSEQICRKKKCFKGFKTLRRQSRVITNRGQVLNTLSYIFVHVSLSRKQQETSSVVIKQEKRNTNNPSVSLFRWKPSEDVWGRLWYLGCVDWQAIFKAPPLILRHIGIFSLPSNGINNIGKEKSLNSLSMFFLWELKSEAQTLNLIIFLYAFFFSLTHPPATKMLLFWSFMGRAPPANATLSIPEPVTFLWGSSELFQKFLHTLAWQLLVSTTPHPHPAVRSGCPSPASQQVHLPMLAVFIFWPSKCKGTQIFQSHGVQSAHRNMQNPSQKVCLLLFKPLSPYTLNSVIKYLRNLD